jgi:CTP synthase
VLDSGLETDQDMGNYERFLEKDLTPEDYMTSGMVYKAVIDRERSLGYKGKFVEAMPHVTDEITRRIKRAAEVNKSDISLIEIGGTVGDYQNILFIEAARALKTQKSRRCIFYFSELFAGPNKIGEMKTRPTQNAVHQLNSYGVQADMIIARSEVPLDQKRKEKIAIWCNVKEDHVISAPDVDNVFDVPLNFEKDKIGNIILESLKLKIKNAKRRFERMERFVKKAKNPKRDVNIAIVGKYFETGEFVLSDAYVSVIEAVKYSAFHQGANPVLDWLSSKSFEDNPKKLKNFLNMMA